MKYELTEEQLQDLTRLLPAGDTRDSLRAMLKGPTPLEGWHGGSYYVAGVARAMLKAIPKNETIELSQVMVMCASGANLSFYLEPDRAGAVAEAIVDLLCYLGR